MYVRWAIGLHDRVSHQKLGVILGAEDWMFLFDEDAQDRLKALIAWFNRHLRVPPRFARSRRKYAEKKAICWFKESAQRHIAQAEAIGKILASSFLTIEKLTTRKPGYVVYEDRHQVAAIPFRDTFAPLPV